MSKQCLLSEGAQNLDHIGYVTNIIYFDKTALLPLHVHCILCFFMCIVFCVVCSNDPNQWFITGGHSCPGVRQ